MEEKQQMSDEHLSTSEKSIKRAPDQKCINHMPPIKRGQKHNSYFRTAGDILAKNVNLELKQELCRINFY